METRALGILVAFGTAFIQPFVASDYFRPITKFPILAPTATAAAASAFSFCGFHGGGASALVWPWALSQPK